MRYKELVVSNWQYPCTSSVYILKSEVSNMYQPTLWLPGLQRPHKDKCRRLPNFNLYRSCRRDNLTLKKVQRVTQAERPENKHVLNSDERLCPCIINKISNQTQIYINSNCMQQGPLLPSKTIISSLRTTQPVRWPVSTVHQLECTYHGQLNKSYQREGFGIVQNIHFETHFGFWRNNQAQGLGLTVYPGGQVVYGNFNRGLLSGPALLDDGKLLQLGAFTHGEQNGVGFEYNFAAKTWAMVRYLHGLPQSKLRQEQVKNEQVIPSMVMTQHSVHQLYQNYLRGNFFYSPIQAKPNHSKQGKQVKEVQPESDKYANINELVVTEQKETLIVGFRDERGLSGICCLYNRKFKQLIEAGYYRNGLLEGYCYQYASKQKRIIGPFMSGMKEGLFLAVLPDRTQGVVFENDEFISNVAITVEHFNKRQKAYNYERKDFLSAKNSFDFNSFYQLFEPPETRHYLAEKKKRQYQAQRQVQGSEWIDHSPQKQFQRTPQRPSRVHDKELGQNSSVALMRQKLREYNMEESESEARLANSRERAAVLRRNLPEFSDNEQEIAEQENPFDMVARGLNLLNESPNRISKQQNDGH